MYIELTDVGPENPSGSLLAAAVADHYWHHSVVRVAVDERFGEGCQRGRLGLASVTGRHRSVGAWALRNLVPEHLRRQWDVVLATEIDATLNAAGYAYGDLWGPKPIERLRRQAVATSQARLPMVMLPQAFGPFINPAIGDAFRHAVQTIPRIYARDRVSAEFVAALLGDDNRVRLAPDITIPVPGRPPHGWAESDAGDRMLVVPSARMLDRHSLHSAEEYRQFLTQCIEIGRQCGLDVALVVHSDEDAALAASILPRLATPPPVFRTRCPLHLKGILSHARIVIASRFHSVVGALSSLTPTIVAGWTHEYNEALVDFDCAELLVTDLNDRSVLRDTIRRVADPSGQSYWRGKIAAARRPLLLQLEAMWRDVDMMIGAPAAQRVTMSATANSSVRAA